MSIFKRKPKIIVEQTNVNLGIYELSANMFASFLVFLGMGVLTFYTTELSFQAGYLKQIIMLAVIINGIYFYYIEICTDSNEQLKSSLRDLGRTEWWIRVIAQCVLFSLWVVLPSGLIPLFVTIFFLHILYIFWDILAWDLIKNKSLAVLDVVGALASVAAAWTVASLSDFDSTTKQNECENLIRRIEDERDLVVILVICLIFYIVPFVISVLTFKFNPFTATRVKIP